MRVALVYLILFANFVSLVHLGLYIVGANLYDVLRIRRASRAPKKTIPSSLKMGKRPPRNPLVTVAISAYNEESGIARTLRSINNSTYKNIEIIVVNDGSKDRTTEVVRDYVSRDSIRTRVASYMSRTGRNMELNRNYIRSHGVTRNIIFVQQANKGKGEALNNAIKNYAHGEYVMTLDADSLLDPKAIERVVEHMKSSRVIGVAANVRIIGDNRWITQLQRFEHIIGYRSKKFYSITGTEFIVGGVASTYRMSTLRQVGFYDTDTMTEDIGLSLKIIAAKGNKKQRIIYASDVVAMTGGVKTYGQLLRQRYRWKMGMLQNLYKHRGLIFRANGKYSLGLALYRLPMSILSEVLLLLAPIMLLYVIAISISYQTLGILLGAYMTITLYTLWNIWPDEYLKPKEKIQMSFMSLYMYVIFYTMDLVQLYAAIRCIRNMKTVVHGSTKTSWTPPSRITDLSPVR